MLQCQKIFTCQAALDSPDHMYASRPDPAPEDLLVPDVTPAEISRLPQISQNALPLVWPLKALAQGHHAWCSYANLGLSLNPMEACLPPIPTAKYLAA